MFSVFLSLATIALIGSSLRWLFPDRDIEEFRQSVNQLVLYILLPALIFTVIYESDLGGVLYEVPLAMVSGIAACLFVAWAILRWFPLDRRTQGSLILASAFGNVTYLGLPVLQGVFSDQALDISKVAILCEVTVGPMNLTVGSLLALRYSEEHGLSLKKSLRQVATLPPLWALAAALVCKFLHLPVPEFILHGAGVLGAAVSALMILSLGMALKPERVDHVLPILTASGIKLLLSPLVVFAAAGMLAIKQPYFEAVTLEGAMPSQLLTIIIADRFNLDSGILAHVVLINTIAAFVTIPLIRSLLFPS